MVKIINEGDSTLKKKNYKKNKSKTNPGFADLVT